jgi:hypothetical protein
LDRLLVTGTPKTAAAIVMHSAPRITRRGAEIASLAIIWSIAVSL